MKTVQNITAYRFHDHIALTFKTDGKLSTQYVTPETARALSAALAEYCDDTSKVRYTESHLSTVVI